jgi:hypothetical protein
MWILTLMIVAALVICSLPLPKTPRHRAEAAVEDRQDVAPG